MDPATMKKYHIAFCGNHAGYEVVARVVAKQPAVCHLLSMGEPALHLLDLQILELKSQFKNRFLLLRGKPCWWDFPYHKKLRVVQCRGHKAYTSQQSHTFFWDEATGVLYVVGGGIRSR